MGVICDSENVFAKIQNQEDGDSCRATWTEEIDCLPLKQRLKLLLATKSFSCNDGSLLVEHHLPENTNANKSSTGAVVKIEQMGDPVSLAGASIDGLSKTKKKAEDEIKTLIEDDILDDLDHVVLASRQKMLLEKQSKSPSNVQKSSSGMGCGVPDTMTQQIPEMVEEKSQFEDKAEMSVKNHFKVSHKCKSPASANGTDDRSSLTAKIPEPQNCYQDKGADNVTDAVQSGGDKKRRFLPKALPKNKPLVTSSVNVKAEPLEGIEAELVGVEYFRRFPSSGMIKVRAELETLDSSCRDELDHMFLSERMKLPSRGSPKLDTYGNLDSSKKLVSSALASQPSQSESANPPKASRPKKRRRTATDSVVTALEEDAPGLFQALVEKGVTVDEMRLYGQTDFEEGLDESSVEESFSDLEAVMSQLFSHRSSLIKLPPLRSNKGERISYCLACLFSLVEQARYLRFRNWPVEWGWCRDLQSFIFVFERHNRIVLERPEYGYATYFFELVNTKPRNWQVKRLVTAMKLAGCSRVALIEDRTLMIGEDMNEGEARVLMEYGWIPNTGLGTMLNYCARVVHDRWNEKDSSEWRSKIGELLVAGYNGGEVVPSCVPVKVEECDEIDAPKIES